MTNVVYDLLQPASTGEKTQFRGDNQSAQIEVIDATEAKTTADRRRRNYPASHIVRAETNVIPPSSETAPDDGCDLLSPHVTDRRRRDRPASDVVGAETNIIALIPERATRSPPSASAIMTVASTPPRDMPLADVLPAGIGERDDDDDDHDDSGGVDATKSISPKLESSGCSAPPPPHDVSTTDALCASTSQRRLTTLPGGDRSGGYALKTTWTAGCPAMPIRAGERQRLELTYGIDRSDFQLERQATSSAFPAVKQEKGNTIKVS